VNDVTENSSAPLAINLARRWNHSFLLHPAYYIYRRWFDPKQPYYQVWNLILTQVKSMVFSNSTKDPNILGAEHFIHILPEFACQDPPLHEVAFDRLFPRKSHPPPLTSCSSCSKPRSKPCALCNLIRRIRSCKSCCYKRQIMHTQVLNLIQLIKLLEGIRRRPTGIETKWIVEKPSIA